jgi:hypothetical protein
MLLAVGIGMLLCSANIAEPSTIALNTVNNKMLLRISQVVKQ